MALYRLPPKARDLRPSLETRGKNAVREIGMQAYDDLGQNGLLWLERPRADASLCGPD